VIRQYRKGRSLAIILALTWLVAAPAAWAQPGSMRSSAARALEEAEQAADAPLRATLSEHTGTATFLAASPARPVPLRLGRGANATRRATTFLSRYGAAVGIPDPSAQVRPLRVQGPDRVGMEHVRFAQVYRDIPITGAGVTVHLKDDAVVAVHAKTLPDLQALDVVPQLSPDDALAHARAWLDKHLQITDARLGEPRLEILNRGLLEGARGATRLAWFVEARSAGRRELIWIDARHGAVLLHFNQQPNALNRLVYTASGGSSLPGSLLRTEGGVPTGDTDADLAYEYAGDTYAYYLTDHGRDSYDDAGATLISTVHWCDATECGSCPCANAFWDGTQMVYGDGYASADDVVAHELTHAVTEHSANLFYYMQSGALNESFSDIFGETVDLTNGAGDDSAGVRWLMGEDLPIGAIRSMSDPTLYGDPGKLGDPQFECNGASSALYDAGGVHFNSGVPNHAYALMTDGGSYNGRTISGIGLAKAAAIQYRALTDYLLSASGFRDDEDAIRQSCQDLIGSAGITATDCVEIGNALDAVQLGDPWPCPPVTATVPALCPAGANPVDVFFDDFENGYSDWQTRALVGSNQWFADGEFASSGVAHLFGNDPGARSDSAVEQVGAVVLPAGARLQFAHAFDFEASSTANYDGGVIEYSIDGGSSWVDAGGLISAGAGYGGAIKSSGSNNPIRGRNAFVKASFRLHGHAGGSVELGRTELSTPFPHRHRSDRRRLRLVHRRCARLPVLVRHPVDHAHAHRDRHLDPVPEFHPVLFSFTDEHRGRDEHPHAHGNRHLQQ
jgi:Zn-dependent metalloprotease